jgi:hypothetical protein
VQSETFINGVWVGQVSLPVAGTGVALRARAGKLAGRHEQTPST